MAQTANRLNYGGVDYVDERMSTESLESLLARAAKNNFDGQTVTVKALSDELSYNADFWYCGGTSKFALQLKSLPEIQSMDDLNAITAALTLTKTDGSTVCLIKEGFRATVAGQEYIYEAGNADNPWEAAENFASNEFSMEVPTDEDEAGLNPVIKIKYGENEIASADLSPILNAWDSDAYIEKGELEETAATEGTPLKSEIKLSYNSGSSRDAISVDVTPLVMMIDGDNVQE